MENLTPEERTLNEAAEATASKIKRAAAIKVINKIAKNAMRSGLDYALISSLTELSIDEIKHLRIQVP